MLSAALNARGPLVLDGGLATELEARGHDLSDALWSARLLRDDPDEIRQVHAAYLEAGADVITTASYQASVEGFVAAGATVDQARSLILRSVELACQARAEFQAADDHADRRRPLVGASIGPYGAALADGSEYRGDYDVGTQALVEFHGPRLELLAASDADFLAMETLPSAPEARVLAALLNSVPDREAWMSFCCRDAAHVADGTPIRDLAAALNAVPNLAALGVNCTAPTHVEGLIREIRRGTDKPVVVYPNSGERWDAEKRAWHGERAPGDFAAWAPRWRDAGARALGGCCRCGPAHIRALRGRLAPSSPPPRP